MSNLTLGFDYANNYHQVVATHEANGQTYRVLVEVDECPEQPYFDGGCPVLSFGTHEAAASVGYAPDSEANDGISRCAEDVLDYFQGLYGTWKGVEVFDRYLRIFHGGSAETIESSVHQGAPWYVTYDTRAMRESWGQTGDMLEASAPSAEEWQAYIDGEVYVVTVQSTEDDPDDDVWTDEEGPVGGYYGEDYAKQDGAELLAGVLDVANIEAAELETYREAVSAVDDRLPALTTEEARKLRNTYPGADADQAAREHFLTVTEPTVQVFRTDDGTAWGVQIDTHNGTGPIRVYVNDSTVATGDPETGIRAGHDTVVKEDDPSIKR